MIYLGAFIHGNSHNALECEHFQDTSDRQESYDMFGFRAGNMPNFMLLTSTYRTSCCKNMQKLQSYLDISKRLKCLPPVEMVIPLYRPSREVVQFRTILLHHETWGMSDKWLRP